MPGVVTTAMPRGIKGSLLEKILLLVYAIMAAEKRVIANFLRLMGLFFRLSLGAGRVCPAFGHF